MNEVAVTFYPEGVQLTCEVARTIFEKERGLMFRPALSDGKGMFFPFLFSWFRVFWMNNVKIPLDIIFVDKNLEVVKIFEAPANVGFFNRKFWAYGFCKYVIECNAGFCRNHRIVPGTKVVYK